MKPERRVGRAIARLARGTISVRLLTGPTRCARLVVIAHDIRRRTLLALTRDAVLRANARLARGAINVGALARTTSEATSCTNTVNVRNLWCLAWLARRRPGVRESPGRTSCTFGFGQATSGACLARDAKEALVVR